MIRSMHESDHYDLIIVGGGIIGTALFYVASNFSNLKKILLIEKHESIGLGATSSTNNSQTLHVGDIETNYSIEKVIETKAASELVLKYSKTINNEERESIIKPVSKMVLGVGEEEVETIEKRYDDKFVGIFPHIKRIEKEIIAKVEPNITKKRDKDEPIIAAYSKDGYMVDFGRLAKSFLKNANQSGKDIKISMGNEVKSVKECKGYHKIITKIGTYKGNFIVFATGGYSLYFAKTLGYGNDLSILSVGGNFYNSKRVLNGKVYRVQKGNIPFAAVHGDPDINYPNITRFGPTVNVVPYLEKDTPSSTYKYMKVFGMDKDTLESIFRITTDKDILDILGKNLVYSVPDLGKYFFLKEEVNRIVPGLKYEDIKFYKGGGGIRPQIIDKKRKKLILGVVDLKAEGIEFDMAPSPGASSCLKEALMDTILATKHLGKEFYRERFQNNFSLSDSEMKLLLKQ